MPRLSKIGAAALAAFGWTTGGASVTATYLVVAGGGGGGSLRGGGGGAGGYLSGTASLNPTLTYTVTVGAGGTGGAGGSGAANPGTSGAGSVFGVYSTAGGGGGGQNSANGLSGGSGGGAGFLGTGGTGNTPSTSPAQGTNGGNGATSAPPTRGGGGGGATSAGATGDASGNGGNGTVSGISGSNVTYAGGGGGGSQVSAGSAGTGGTGGGGAGSATADGTAGTANLGGGGGGSGYPASTVSGTGGNGGSGIVIISYTAPQKFSGGVVTLSGGNVIHTFTTSGTLGPITTLSASYLIVAGGGAGGGAPSADSGEGGGGGGGLLSGSGLTIDPNSTYLVTVGAGGASTTVRGSNGSDSSFSMVSTAAVGGGGGGGSGANPTGASGGSGGGGRGAGSGSGWSGGTGTAGQGNTGGSGAANGSEPGGGGGGAGAAGSNGSGSTGGAGGAGSASSISGTLTYYAGGGGGGVYSGTGGAGGTGGGGSATSSGTGAAGTANTGGGGAGTSSSGAGATGGSGVVIISYPGSTQQMAGGTVTIVGGNVIHTFTSTGYLAPIKYVSNSLRFRSSASAYLSKTFSTAGNVKTYTISFWTKRGTLSTTEYLFVGFNGSVSSQISFNSSDQLVLNVDGGSSYQIISSAVYRDPAAWYHIVATVDTTQATASDRLKLYVNGVQLTSFSTSSYPPQNNSTYFFGATAHWIGSSQVPSQYFDGYLAEFNAVNGQALTPNSFGTFNSYGVWQPITYGGSYGTNGFYLPFTNATSTTTLGYDFSPNGNNWTTNNISLTAGSTYDSMTDVPTLTSATAANYPTLDPNNPTYTDGTGQYLSAGNLIYTPSGDYSIAKATMAFPKSGKFYIEATIGATGTPGVGMVLGILRLPGSSTSTNSYVTYQSTYGYAYDRAGYIYKGTSATTVTSGLTTSSNNDVIAMAVDVDNQTVTWYRNNVSLYTLNLSTAPDGYYLNDGEWIYAVSAYGGAASWNVNFGQRPFTYTPPTGFVALNTYNL